MNARNSDDEMYKTKASNGRRKPNQRYFRDVRFYIERKPKNDYWSKKSENELKTEKR